MEFGGENFQKISMKDNFCFEYELPYAEVKNIKCYRKTVHPDIGEDVTEFARRRSRATGRVMKTHGFWSGLWLKKSKDWDSHVRRQNMMSSWGKPLLHWRGLSWLDQRKFAQSRSRFETALAGR